MTRGLPGTPQRADLVGRARDRRWSSLRRGLDETADERALLSEWPIERRRDRVEHGNEPMNAAELEALRLSSRRGRPLGGVTWSEPVVRRLRPESTLRPRGRPRKLEKGSRHLFRSRGGLSSSLRQAQRVGADAQLDVGRQGNRSEGRAEPERRRSPWSLGASPGAWRNQDRSGRCAPGPRPSGAARQHIAHDHDSSLASLSGPLKAAAASRDDRLLVADARHWFRPRR
jgi:hypothetical protein